MICVCVCAYLFAKGFRKIDLSIYLSISIYTLIKTQRSCLRFWKKWSIDLPPVRIRSETSSDTHTHTQMIHLRSKKKEASKNKNKKRKRERERRNIFIIIYQSFMVVGFFFFFLTKWLMLIKTILLHNFNSWTYLDSTQIIFNSSNNNS